MNTQNYEGFTNITVFDLFLVLFVGLKIAGVINWSWWWVLSPLFIMPGIYVVSFILGFMYMVIINLIKKQE